MEVRPAYGVSRIASNPPRAARAHRFRHLAHGALHTDEHRARHDRVADVELAELAHSRDLAHVQVVESVARVYREPQFSPETRGVQQLAQRRLARARAARVR